MPISSLAVAVVMMAAGASQAGDDPVATAAPPARASVDLVVDALMAREVDRVHALDRQQVGGFRRWIYDSVASLENRRLRAEFYARYRTPAEFDEAAFKEFLMLNPAASIVGIDTLPGGSFSTESVLRIGAHAAREDRRYRERFTRAGADGVLRDAEGDPIPVDPAVLNVGPVQGAGSDSYAWLAFAPVSPTTDPAALRREPWNVISPVATGDTVLAMGPAYAQLYADLAALAALGDDDWSGLARLFAGGSIAHLVAAASAFNTTQFGSYEIHPREGQGWWNRLRRLFGRGTPAVSLTVESALRATRLRLLGHALPGLLGWEPRVAAGPGGQRHPRPEGDWAERLAREQAADAREQAVSAFAAVHILAVPEVTDHPFDQSSRIDAETAARLVDLDGPDAAEAVERLRRLHEAQVTRASEGAIRWMHSWRVLVDREVDDSAAVQRRILGRLVTRQLEYLSQADVRRMRYMVEQAEESG